MKYTESPEFEVTANRLYEVLRKEVLNTFAMTDFSTRDLNIVLPNLQAIIFSAVHQEVMNKVIAMQALLPREHKLTFNDLWANAAHELMKIKAPGIPLKIEDLEYVDPAFD